MTDEDTSAIQEMYAFVDAQDIEAQFPEANRGTLSYENLKIALEELSPEQLQKPIVLVDKTSGTTFAAIDLVMPMHIVSAALAAEIAVNLEDLNTPDMPMIVF